MELAIFEPQERDAAGESFVDILGLVRHTVRQFALRHGGDPEELFGEAQIAYLKGYQAMQRGLNNSPRFEVEIRRWVWFELFDAHRTRTQFRCQNPVVIKATEWPERIPDADGNSTELRERMEGLGEDAGVVVGLVIDTPEHLAAVARKKGGTPRNFRSTIRAYLRDLGWGAERITEAFEEIAIALS